MAAIVITMMMMVVVAVTSFNQAVLPIVRRRRRCAVYFLLPHSNRTPISENYLRLQSRRQVVYAIELVQIIACFIIG